MRCMTKRHGLTLQWRLALTSATILAAACLLLTLVFNHSAGAELDNLEIQVVQLQPNTGDAAQISGGIAAPEQMQIPQHFSNSRSTLRMESAAATTSWEWPEIGCISVGTMRTARPTVWRAVPWMAVIGNRCRDGWKGSARTGFSARTAPCAG